MAILDSAYFCAFLAVFCWIAIATPTGSSGSESPLVLIVSFDGFRWDYQTKTDTPNFDKLGSTGVRARYTKDVFITKTFPNHFTLVTGLFEESHGIVGNAMYDPLFNSSFWMNNNETRWWSFKGGEPIWTTNQRRGGISSVVFWPSSNVNFSGILPDFYFPEYNQSFPFNDRVDIIVDNFKNGRANFGALYFHEPDHSGHMYGPEDPIMIPVIKMCDDTMGYLMQRLKDSGLYNRINIIVTSDHGMTTISPDKVIVVEDYVDPAMFKFKVVSNNPILSIWPENEQDTDAIYKCLHGKNPHMTVYLKQDIPTHFYYRDNRRISPILLVAHEGWQVHSNSSGEWPTNRGTHGYNNSLMSMHPFFIAQGPAFKKGYVAAPFSSTNVYPLMCHILGIEPLPNNGSVENVMALLAESDDHHIATGGQVDGSDTSDFNSNNVPHHKGIPKFTIFGVSVAVGLVILVVSLLAAMCLKQRTYREKPLSYQALPDTSLSDQETQEPFLPNSRV